MKKIASIIIAICMCAMLTFTLSGCGSNDHTLKNVYDMYETMARSDSIKAFFTNGTASASSSNPINITYSSDVINNKKLDPNSSMYILTAVYEPLLEMASKFYISTKGAFRLQIETNKATGAKQEDINDLYDKLVAVGNALNELAHEKETFELLEQGSGYRVNDYLVYYKNALRALFDFNIDYANLYLNGIFAYKDYSQKNIDISDPFDQETARVYFNYCELRLGKIAFDYYVDNYSFSADPKKVESITTWLNGCTELNNLMTVFRGTKSNDSTSIFKDKEFKITTDNVTLVRAALIDYQRSTGDFDAQTQMFYKAISNINLKEYFAESATGKTYYLDNCSKLERAYFDFAQNYLSYHFEGYVGWLNRMSGIFA